MSKERYICITDKQWFHIAGPGKVNSTVRKGDIVVPERIIHYEGDDYFVITHKGVHAGYLAKNFRLIEEIGDQVCERIEKEINENYPWEETLKSA